ncbi:KIAA0586 [Branchiostoma lanceolatum]|uniref:KIAA0586 protein n=1 Tax=Branchiostoma lanceolatum TaxID=7740 RepID=A0A8J9ZT01_BRALA|nr:KIAA0586 [Branchiostoma lanceolatum]
MAASPATQLLSITSAAVSALGKSSQSSHSSGSSGGARPNTGLSFQPTVTRHFEQTTERRQTPLRQESSSSGGEKESDSTADKKHDQDNIKGTEAEMADSANSSSASEILIRSTVLDHDKSLISKSMNTSSDSRASFGSSGSQRVRVPRKLLKEVRSPFERDEATGVVEHVPAPLPGNLPPGKEDRTEESDVPSVPVLAEQEEQEVLISYLKQREARSDRPSTLPTSKAGRVRDRPQSPAAVAVQPPASYSVAAASDVVIQTLSPPHKVGSAAGTQQGALLQQGAAVEGMDITVNQDAPGDDVKVSRFQLTEKQKLLKSQLGRRQDRTAPVKKVVQPRVIKHLVAAGGDENKPPNRQETAGVDTASIAAATAAAVAATAPFFQAHTDLESKISSINEKLSRLQESYQDKSSAARQSDQQIHHQLQQLTDMRIKFLEQLQQQQLDWQAKTAAGMVGRQPAAETYQTRPAAVSAPGAAPDQPDSRPNPPGYDDWTHPKYVPVEVHHHGPTYPAAPRPTPATHGVSSRFATTHATQTSPLDTPAPRKHPPVPIPKDNSLERADRMARLQREVEEHSKGKVIHHV